MADGNSDDIRVNYDLVSTLAPFLDLHMMFPLIQHLQSCGLYNEEDLSLSLLEILRATNMVDYTLEILGGLDNSKHNDNETNALEERRELAVKELAELEDICSPLLTILRDEEQLQDLITKGQFNMADLQENFGIDENIVDAFYRYGKFNYEIGNYQDTTYIMLYYRELAPSDAPNAFMALWGKISSQLLMLRTTDNLANTLKDIQALQKILDERDDVSEKGPTFQLEQLQFRSWLLHWSLFLFFKFPIEDPGEDTDGSAVEAGCPNAESANKFLLGQMVDFFFHRKHLAAIQTNCPWLLRYLVVAVFILYRSGDRKYRRFLSNVCKQEAYHYKDPLTTFVDNLYINFNFDKAHETLKECEIVMSNDFFLQHLVDDFLKNARMAIFETFCLIHTKIDTKMLSGKVDVAEEDAEAWLVNLIQGAKMGAKIDSKQNCVVMSQQYPEAYQQVIDKTKDLVFRSYQLCNEVQHLHQREERERERGEKSN